MATILPFPSRPRDEQRLALLGQHLRDSFPLPGRNDELLIHCAMAEVALVNHRGETCQSISELLRELRK